MLAQSDCSEMNVKILDNGSVVVDGLVIVGIDYTECGV